MFLSFTKESEKNRRCVFLGDAVVMEYGNRIVGVAKLHEETDKCLDYDVIVAGRCELGAERIARYIKGIIAKSNKFSDCPTTKRRKYYLDVVECDVLPVRPRIVFDKA